MDVILQYHDLNGHNFNVLANVPDIGLVDHVVVELPEAGKRAIRAVKTYKDCGGHTIRATWIKDWLRCRFPYHTIFSAKLLVSEDGKIHTYYDIKPIDEP